MYVSGSFQLPPPVTVNAQAFPLSSTSRAFEKHPSRKPRPMHIPHQHRPLPPPPPTSWLSALFASFLATGLVQIVIAGLQSLFCLLYLITGHAILRAAHYDCYDAPIASSARAGALGGAIMTIPAVILCVFRHEGPIFVFLSMAFDTAIGAMAGSIGVFILTQGVHKTMLDVLHASRAGALGAVIFSLAFQLLKLVIQ